MTTNQLRFAELKENQRHSRETERQGQVKLDRDYTIGMSQASAAHRQAGAAESQAATRAGELAYAQYVYETTGKQAQQAQTDNQLAQAQKSRADAVLTQQKLETEKYNTQIAGVEYGSRQRLLNAQIGNTKSGTFKNITSGVSNVVDTVGGAANMILQGVQTIGALAAK